MKKQWLLYVPVILYVVAWAWIFYASAQAGCSDNVGMSQVQGGLCMARRIAGLSCFAVYFAVWTYLGGLVAKGKGRNPLIGWTLGFILQFLGCFFMMSWEPMRDNLGRMIGWAEYKHLRVEAEAERCRGRHCRHRSRVGAAGPKQPGEELIAGRGQKPDEG